MKNTHKRMLTLLMAAVMFFSFTMTACAFQIPDINLIKPTNPPATNPPATNPPATNPPATNPPATNPPATNPPATNPPVTEPPATNPPATEPPVTEPRDIATGLLTDAEKAVLAALTLEQYNEVGSVAANQKIAIWAYGEANIDVSTYFDLSTFNLMKAIFTGDGSTGRTPIQKDATGYNANYSKMLVDGYYGGVDVKTEDKLFTAADFQVGDLFFAVYYPDPSSTAKNYYAGLYLGDGKFLMSNNADGWHATIDSELVFKSTLADELAIYFVLRPEQLALAEVPSEPDSSEPAPSEPEVTEPRDIATGLLTDAEKAVLAALTLEQYNEAGSAAANQKIAIWAYEKAGIDISKYLDKSVFNMMKAIFAGDGNSESGRTPILEGQTGYNATYSKMLVDGYYGGVDVKTADKLFTAADFQVGDLFCAVYYPDPSSTAKNYYAGLYLGDGKFLMSNNVGSWHAAIDSELVFKSTLAEELAIYFVLRPEQLALAEQPGTDSTDPTPSVPETSDPTPSVPETSDPTPSVPETSDPTPSVPETSDPTPSVPETSEPATGLTDAQKEAIAAITVEDLAAAKKTNDTGVIKWFCQKVGMASSDVSSFSSIVTISTSLFNKSDDADWTVKTMDSSITYHKLFVEGYYGGLKFGANSGKSTFTASDFEIGDIFCAQGTDSNRFVGLYQGNGQFLMYNYNEKTNTVDTTMAFDANLATSYNYYFVLRPTQFLFPAN